MSRLPLLLLSLALLSGCVSGPQRLGPPTGSGELAPFQFRDSASLPPGWAPLAILRDRNPTEYRLVKEAGASVLHARADAASSALMHELGVDPHRQPWLSWRWKIKTPTRMPDSNSPQQIGSPARIVLGFDGDKDSLPFGEQILFETARVMTGHDFPYATLMYVWGNGVPQGTIVQSRHSSRIRMVVVESGSEGLGNWRRFERNIVEDYVQVFGELPGRLLGIGVLTDDETFGEVTEAWYADIRLSNNPPHNLAGPAHDRTASPLSLSLGQ